MLVALLLAGLGFIYWRYLASIPVDYASDVDHFKYGSIGGDSYDGIPLRIWKVLPAVFSEYLPEDAPGMLACRHRSERIWMVTANSALWWSRAAASDRLFQAEAVCRSSWIELCGMPRQHGRRGGRSDGEGDLRLRADLCRVKRD